MSKPKSRKKDVRRSNTGWGTLLAASQVELKNAQQRVQKLKLAVKIFANNVAKGEPFPLTEMNVENDGANSYDRASREG